MRWSRIERGEAPPRLLIQFHSSGVTGSEILLMVCRTVVIKVALIITFAKCIGNVYGYSFNVLTAIQNVDMRPSNSQFQQVLHHLRHSYRLYRCWRRRLNSWPEFRNQFEICNERPEHGNLKPLAFSGQFL